MTEAERLAQALGAFDALLLVVALWFVIEVLADAFFSAWDWMCE